MLCLGFLPRKIFLPFLVPFFIIALTAMPVTDPAMLGLPGINSDVHLDNGFKKFVCGHFNLLLLGRDMLCTRKLMCPQ